MKHPQVGQPTVHFPWKFFGKTTRRFLLIQAIARNHNHYGQLVYYLRLNGIAPPTSGG